MHQPMRPMRDSMRRQVVRRAFTFVEVLVVFSIIAILLALLMPTLMKVRETSQRSQCQINLQRLIGAVLAYHDVNSHLPYSVSPWPEGYPTAGPGPHNGRGWIIETLPYMENKELYIAFEPSRTGDMFGSGLVNCKTEMQTQLVGLRCPVDRAVPKLEVVEFQWEGISVAVTNYKGVIGTSNMGGGWPDSPSGTTDNHYNQLCTGLFFRNSNLLKINVKLISDGASNTLAIGEDVPEANYHGAAFYANGDYASSHAPLNYFPNPPDPTNWPKVMSFRSRHPRGVNFAAADGSVHFINDDIDRLLYQQLCTRGGGEAKSIPR